MDAKVCSKCNVNTPISGFNRRSSAPDGLQVWCRTCQAEISAKRRAADPEKVRAYNAKYRQENRAACDAATQRWRDRNKERVAAQKQAWAAANPDKVQASRERNHEHTKHHRAARLSEWKRNNREAVREYQRRRRAAGYGGPIDLIDPEDLWAKSNGCCGICGETVDRALAWPDPLSASVDHITALSRGGIHAAENCQIAHLRCNMRKGNRD